MVQTHVRMTRWQTIIIREVAGIGKAKQPTARESDFYRYGKNPRLNDLTETVLTGRQKI